MKIGKYEFPDENAFKAVDALADRDVDTVAVFGFVNENYCVDVLWYDTEPSEWSPYRVSEPSTNHVFRGYPYNQYKIQD
jgi:hypothetical protein